MSLGKDARVGHISSWRKRRSSPRTGVQSSGKRHTDARAHLISFTQYVLDLTIHMSKRQ